MAVSNSKKIVLGLIFVIAYHFWQSNEDQRKYDELITRPVSTLSQEDKEFIKYREDKRAKDEAEMKQYRAEEKRKKEANKAKPLSEQVLLQNDVIFSCNEVARRTLSFPDSFEVEQTESGIDDNGESKIYYYTLHYSGINAFNARGIHTVECYGTVGDREHKVTYKTFN